MVVASLLIRRKAMAGAENKAREIATAVMPLIVVERIQQS
jgi:hypothetical protein